MMNLQYDRGELSFSPDFAARVITEADAIRRRRRVVGYSSLTLLVASAVTASVFLSEPARHAARAPVVASISNPRVDFSPNMPTNPLQFLFPDAAPVAKFADAYSTANYGRERRPGEFLFTEQDASDL
ncbi:MAG TPA: hypothetical protein VGG69_03725 [Rhizomicrobium sp.]